MIFPTARAGHRAKLEPRPYVFWRDHVQRQLHLDEGVGVGTGIISFGAFAGATPPVAAESSALVGAFGFLIRFGFVVTGVAGVEAGFAADASETVLSGAVFMDLREVFGVTLRGSGVAPGVAAVASGTVEVVMSFFDFLDFLAGVGLGVGVASGGAGEGAGAIAGVVAALVAESVVVFIPFCAAAAFSAAISFFVFFVNLTGAEAGAGEGAVVAAVGAAAGALVVAGAGGIVRTAGAGMTGAAAGAGAVTTGATRGIAAPGLTGTGTTGTAAPAGAAALIPMFAAVMK